MISLVLKLLLIFRATNPFSKSLKRKEAFKTLFILLPALLTVHGDGVHLRICEYGSFPNTAYGALLVFKVELGQVLCVIAFIVSANSPFIVISC